MGTGCAGLTAAIVAAKKQGLTVLVVEKSRYIGGTTAFSNSGLWVPCNHYQQSQGVSDSKELAFAYLQAVIGEDHCDGQMIDSFLENAPRMVRWLDENTALHFTTSPLPDYHQDKKGALLVGRSLRNTTFDGRKLGRDRLKDIRYVLQGFKLFDSMQMSAEERSILFHPLASLFNLRCVVRKAFRYLTDLFWYGKGSFLANGNALVGSLVYSLDLENDVEIWKNAAVTGIVISENRAAGVVINRQPDSASVRIHARKGILLATGGVGRSNATEQSQEYCLSPKSVSGDGICLATQVGAALPSLNVDYAIYAPVSVLRPKAGSDCPVRIFPHFGYDRAKPGSIIVNQQGHRFTSESEGYHQFVQKMYRSNVERCFLIGDSTFLRKYGMGFALPSPYPISSILASNYLLSAPTLPELAQKIEVPGPNLLRAVEQNNENATLGKDPEFRRGNGSYDRFLGDPSHKPHPNLGACTKAPFYALRIYPGNVSTLYGLITNEHAQVLGKSRKPIQGLYAAGNDQNSLWRGTYPSGGSWLSPSMTFGFVAAEHMAKF